jgi:hypothetical protein
MTIAHPFLIEEPWPTKKMTKAQLEARIERVLALTNIGYLGTVKKDGTPIVSPVEFYAEDMSLYIFPQPNSPKAKAIARDGRISFAVANPMVKQHCSMLALRNGSTACRFLNGLLPHLNLAAH